jgi:hypothetical protein
MRQDDLRIVPCEGMSFQLIADGWRAVCVNHTSVPAGTFLALVTLCCDDSLFS